jgi:hypothetical protein
MKFLCIVFAVIGHSIAQPPPGGISPELQKCMLECMPIMQKTLGTDPSAAQENAPFYYKGSVPQFGFRTDKKQCENLEKFKKCIKDAKCENEQTMKMTMASMKGFEPVCDKKLKKHFPCINKVLVANDEKCGKKCEKVEQTPMKMNLDKACTSFECVDNCANEAVSKECGEKGGKALTKVFQKTFKTLEDVLKMMTSMGAQGAPKPPPVTPQCQKYLKDGPKKAAKKDKKTGKKDKTKGSQGLSAVSLITLIVPAIALLRA